MMHYVGRFAPSPSGELHFGSLVCAVASYLQAKAKHGEWLVRIEDIDPPREVAGSDKKILQTLEAFGLYWDRQVLYQSSRLEYYHSEIKQLLAKQQAYYCDCSRHDIQADGGFYRAKCRQKQLSPNSSTHNLAVRFKQDLPCYQFVDQLRGLQQVAPQLAQEDFIIQRRDGLIAYNLAVVLDDHYQGITEVVRGADLLLPTARQISLFHYYHWPVPNYLHLPLALDQSGNKLSKQNHAPAIAAEPDLLAQLAKVLQFLHQPLPTDWRDAKLEQLLDWAIQHWQVMQISQQDQIVSLTTELR